MVHKFIAQRNSELQSNSSVNYKMQRRPSLGSLYAKHPSIEDTVVVDHLGPTMLE